MSHLVVIDSYYEKNRRQKDPSEEQKSPSYHNLPSTHDTEDHRLEQEAIKDMQNRLLKAKSPHIYSNTR